MTRETRELEPAATAAGANAENEAAAEGGATRSFKLYSPRGGKHARKIKKKKIAVIVLIVLLALSAAGYGTYRYLVYKGEQVLRDKIAKDIHHAKKQPKQLSCVDVHGYVNIALLGVDSRDMSENALTNANSDCIMVMSINTKTNKITLTSVYRDTYLRINGTSSYDKINSALSHGGPESTMRSLNQAMDLNIKNYVVFNFKMVADLVDEVGGITVDVQPYEIYQLNKYTVQTADNIGRKHYKLVQSAGKQKLDGVQAVSYGRIRKGVGDDFKRTDRMRQVLKLVAAKLKGQKLTVLGQELDSSLKECTTNLSTDDMMSLAKRLRKLDFTESKGFPYHVKTGYLGQESFVFPTQLVSDVRALHRNIFGQEDYHPTDTVYKENAEIGSAPVTRGPTGSN